MSKAPSWPEWPKTPNERSVPGNPTQDQQRKSEGGSGVRRATGRDSDNGTVPMREPWDASRTSSATDVPPPAGTKFALPKASASTKMCHTSGGDRPCNTMRSVRNNNPGAIEGGPNYKSHGITGVVGGEPSGPPTTTFINAKYGFAAQTKLLNSYRKDNGIRTFRDLGNRYSSNSYGQEMANEMGMGIDDEITDEQWNDPEWRYKLQRFMAMHEAGARDGQESQGVATFEDLYDPQDLIDGLEMGGVSTKKKKQDVGAPVKPQSRSVRMPPPRDRGQ